MTTNLKVDYKLKNEAVKVGRHKTQQAAVKKALEEYILRKKQSEVVKLFNKIEYEKDYNYKKQRSAAWKFLLTQVFGLKHSEEKTKRNSSITNSITN